VRIQNLSFAARSFKLSLMSDRNKPVTEERLQEILQVVLKKYATKKELVEALKENNIELLEMFHVMMKQSESQYKDLKQELRTYAGVLIEDAEARFLKTGHDRISVCEDRLKAHETRLIKVETVVL